LRGDDWVFGGYKNPSYNLLINTTPLLGDWDFYYYEPKYREPQVHDDGVSVYIIPATEENIAPESETNPLRWVFPSFLAMDLMTILLVGMVVRLPRTPKRLSGTRVRSVHEDHGKVKVKME